MTCSSDGSDGNAGTEVNASRDGFRISDRDKLEEVTETRKPEPGAKSEDTAKTFREGTQINTRRR